MASKKNKPSPPEISTPRYRGSNRRDPNAADETVEIAGVVTFDAKGNAVWQTGAAVPRRRRDDGTIDSLKCLDLDSLSLQDEGSPQDESRSEAADGYNPYNRDDE
jgi:hypothetical protein